LFGDFQLEKKLPAGRTGLNEGDLLAAGRNAEVEKTAPVSRVDYPRAAFSVYRNIRNFEPISKAFLFDEIHFEFFF